MKTHQERAQEAATRMGAARGWQVTEKADLIAEETYPTELIGAARSAANCINKGPGLCRLCHARLDAALALYLEHP
jgi:hypothetical protein